MLNKRDIRMLKRRNDQLKHPNHTEVELVLEKYQATEKKLAEVKDFMISDSCPIQTLYIYQNQMDEHKTDVLCEAIQQNRSLRVVHIIKCMLRQNQLTKLCQAICNHRSQSIQEIHISQMKINRQGAQAIGQVLTNIHGLKKLELIETSLDNDDLKSICQGIENNKCLEYLDLRRNNFEEKGLVALVKALKKNMSVKNLFLEDLKFNQKQARVLADLLGKENCNIQNLALNQGEFDMDSLDIIMEALYQADHLQKLSLAKNILNVTICEHLSEIPKRLHHFQILCLSHCEISDDALKSLCAGFYGVTTIKELDLSWNNIDSEGMQIILEMLKNNKSLERLLIQHNYLQVEGAKQMVEALKLHPEIIYLDISANEITSQGFMYFKELFESNHRLRNLHLRKNAIDGTQILNLPKSLNDNTNLYYLDLKDNEIENECAQKLIDLLRMNYFIEDLVIKGNIHISQNLKETIMDECRKNLMIKEYVIPNLNTYIQNDQIQTPEITASKIQPEKQQSHFKNYNVEYLNLADCSFSRSDFIVKFIKMNQKDFHSLSLTRVHFDEHIKDLADFLNKSNTQIKQLTLNDCDIGDTSITQLMADIRVLKNLRELRLIKMNMKMHAKEILKYTLDHKNLRLLDLSHNNLSKMTCISDLLTKNQVLQVLNLKGNPIYKEQDLRSLLFGLTQNISVIELLFDKGFILDNSNPNLTLQKELSLIEQQLLINLYIKQEILPKQEQRKQKLTDKCDLSHCFDFMSPEMRPDIKDSIIKAIEKYIMIQVPGQPKKTKINMSYCRMDDSTVLKFVEGWLSDVVQQRIDFLDLSYNHIGDESCKHLSRLLLAEFHLAHLVVGRNESITKEGFMSLTKAIRTNNHIKVLDCQTCNIELDGHNKAQQLERELILEDIMHNCSLMELDLQFNRINEQWLKRVNTELQHNKLIEEMIVPSIKKKEEKEIQKVFGKVQQKDSLSFSQRLKDSTSTINKNIFKRLTDRSGKKALKEVGKKGGTTTLDKFSTQIETNEIQLDLDNPQKDEDSNDDIISEEEERDENDSDQDWYDKKGHGQLTSPQKHKKKEAVMNKLSLKGKGLKSLDFLEKYIRVHPNLVDIDIGDNPLTNQEMQKFTMNMRRNQLIHNIGVEGIKDLDSKTKHELEKEIDKNKKIKLLQEQIKGNLDKDKIILQQKNIQHIDFLHKFMESFQDLKVLDLNDNSLGNHGAIEICNLIKETKTIEILNLQKNRIGPSGLSHICSAMSVNESIKILDIRYNKIQDESLKALLAMLYKNEVVQQVKYTVTNEENIQRLDEFRQISHLTVEEIEKKMMQVHHEEFTKRQKLCLPLWCWKSFIHAKHEAFRFKYDSKKLKLVEQDIMPAMAITLYINSLIYYIIVIMCPMLFVNECGMSLNLVSHFIYAMYSLFNWICEIFFVVWIQRKIDNKQVLSFNRWHFVESIMGQVARFDTYLDVCFLALVFQCSEWYLVIPIGTLILIYTSYPIYMIVKDMYMYNKKTDHEYAMPRMERNCDLCFVRENMLMATVLDSFCIDNQTEVCKKPQHFGRVQAIWTLATQDGPQMLIHLLFMFLVQNDISHSDTTVVMSIIVSTFAIGISVFNIIMCQPNEFDPVLVQIELKKRQDQVNLREENFKTQREELKKRMLANFIIGKSKAAELANIGMAFNKTKKPLHKMRSSTASEPMNLRFDIFSQTGGSDNTSIYSMGKVADSTVHKKTETYSSKNQNSKFLNFNTNKQDKEGSNAYDSNNKSHVGLLEGEQQLNFTDFDKPQKDSVTEANQGIGRGSFHGSFNSNKQSNIRQMFMTPEKLNESSGGNQLELSAISEERINNT